MLETDVKLNIFLNANKLYAKVEVLNENINILQGGGYAFYLFRNGIKVKTLWYSCKNKIVFDLDETGAYKVVCFVKVSSNSSNVVIKESKEIFFYKEPIDNYVPCRKIPLEINIFGSCVSRDILEFASEELFDIKLGIYIARQSLISSVSLSANINWNDIKLSSNFQKKMVLYDMNKMAFELLFKNKRKYLMIDLIDERFALGKFGDSIITYSSCTANAGFNNQINLLECTEKNGKYYFQGFDIDIYLAEFCKRISQIYESQNIIIHEAKLLDFYMNNAGYFEKFEENITRRNRITNRKLSYIYTYLKNYFPDCICIDISNLFFAYENNKWGLAPMHYCSQYYKKAAEKLHAQITNILI